MVEFWRAGGPGAGDTELLMRQHNKTKNLVQATYVSVDLTDIERVDLDEALDQDTEAAE